MYWYVQNHGSIAKQYTHTRRLKWHLNMMSFQKESPLPGAHVQLPCWASGVDMCYQGCRFVPHTNFGNKATDGTKPDLNIRETGGLWFRAKSTTLVICDSLIPSLKMDGWKTILSFWEQNANFQVLLLSFRECNISHNHGGLEDHFPF